MRYNFTEIEKKWQSYWSENKTFRTQDFDGSNSDKPKYYVLGMFPYPSGVGLHVGHAENYTAPDIIARYKRLKGFSVMHPMGWDAFGLPTEQYAMKTGIHPRIRTEECITSYKNDLNSLGLSYDWEREIDTSDESYFRWTQWMFLKIFNSFYDEKTEKARPISELEIPGGLSEKEKYDYINSQRLAFLAEVPVNWSPELGTVLSNEEVAEQVEKGFTVVRKKMKQWNLRITKYAERLLNDLDELDWPSNIKELQKNWIGKSIGASIKFKIKSDSAEEKFIEVFSTRPDTIFGATYLILAPEHTLVKEITLQSNLEKVKSYLESAERKSDLERTELSRDKTGEFTGAVAVNPVNGKEIPVLIADYVLASYGTGAIMGVPGHDERDNEFAKKYKLEIIPVVIPENYDADQTKEFLQAVSKGEVCYPGGGISVNSEFLNGLNSNSAIEKINKWLESNGFGKSAVNYKLRDWLFSRQRFWGEPFPIIHFPDGKFESLEENELPLKLPDVESYKSSGTGESPLANIESWLYAVDKESGIKVRRETNTMPQWAGSCWYFLRFLDPRNNEIFCDPEKERKWMPVDLYIGGTEHAVLHLIYSRFWYKVLFDLGYVSHNEPFRKLFNQGMILGEDGVKMSKSRGNVITTKAVINDYGVDSLRLFIMFLGPLEATKPWSAKGVEGLNRFLNRIWRLIIDENTGGLKSNIINDRPDEKTLKLLHKTIKRVTEDIEDGDMKFNTAISYLMIFINELYKMENISREVIQKFVILLSPFAPHISEELWERLGNESDLRGAQWPEYDTSLVREETATVVFQVNGKIRAKQDFDFDSETKILEDSALNNEKVKKYISGKEIRKIITIKNKMVNIVVS